MTRIHDLCRSERQREILARMRPPLALLAIAMVSAGVCSCGGASTEATPPAASGASSNRAISTASPTSTADPTASDAPGASTSDFAKVDGDRDNDVSAPNDDSVNHILEFGHEATAAEKRSIAALIKRYYAVALSGNGAQGCALIYSPLAESVPEDFGTASPPGPPYMRGTTCPVVMAGLYRHLHTQLEVEVPKLQVARVRLQEHHGIALLRFGALPERLISFGHEGHAWRMTQLIDVELP
jgi:hypothetical protein